MAVSDKPWGDISPADYASAEDYCNSCLIDLNPPGEPKVKGLCKLSVKEPAAMGGAINRAGCHAAASVLAGGRGGVDAPTADKRAAARRLMTIYRRDLEQDPPASLMQLAGM